MNHVGPVTLAFHRSYTNSEALTLVCRTYRRHSVESMFYEYIWYWYMHFISPTVCGSWA